MSDLAITPQLVAEHGLNEAEYARVLEILGRTPTLTELGIFSVMWSEHCSYKSSRKWLRQLPTKAPWVICGPGENAGIIDLGNDLAAVFKIESHNHPSFIEPYQGAATGVGGILRDVFTMGARPIANLNSLRFGAPEHPKTRHLVAGVVAGIGGYGNCIGVPTVAGECSFHPAYNGNILVNAMTVGLVAKDKIFYSAAVGTDNVLVYVGSKTGRDGIHGATMASAAFDDESEAKRPTVQVGDPFTEKLLLEACLELMAGDDIVAIQDMGAAGLTSSSFEMASKGGSGVELDLDQVPVREKHMTAYEIMLSESQERMLMVLRPDATDRAAAIFKKWDLDMAIVGKLTESGRMVVKRDGKVAADLPIEPLVAAAPEYDRPWTPTCPRPPLHLSELPPPDDLEETLLRLLGAPDLSSRRWIWEQYDHMVMTNTVARPGGDAAVLRLDEENSEKRRGLAVTVDCTPRYCAADPVTGGAQAVVETWRNLTAVGARPLAITDCMNFGNPERPEIMGQFVGCIEGMRRACEALDYPVVSGNVSFYNETGAAGVLPTPTIGGVGLIDDLDRMATLALKQEGEIIVLIGKTAGHLGASLYLREIESREDGAPPPIDLTAERQHGDFVRHLIAAGRVSACHDISDGGLLVALVEMALAGDTGAHVTPPEEGNSLFAWLFGEDQARYLITTPQNRLAKLLEEAQTRNIPAQAIGKVGGRSLTVQGRDAISLETLRDARELWFPAYMGEVPSKALKSLQKTNYQGQNG